MRDASQATKDFLAIGAPGFYADLFTLTLIDGTTFRWTSFDVDIYIAPDRWHAQGPLLERSSLSARNSVEVPELRLKLGALDTDFIDGTNIKLQIARGAFDGARMQLDRLVMAFPADTTYTPPITLFVGRVGQTQITATGGIISVKGDVVIMNQYTPHNVFQTACQWTFCDTGCTLQAVDFTTGFTVQAADLSFVSWVGVAPNFLKYRFGRITFISGANTGQSRFVRDVNSMGVVASYPWFITPAPGDAFQILQGCDKRFSGTTGQSCTDYANTQHFRGFEFIPSPEFAL